MISIRLEKRSISLILEARRLALEGELELGRKYIKLARAYAAKGRFRLPLPYRRMFCRRCNTPLVPGKTERVRIKSKILIRTCLICGWIRRYELREVKKSDGGKISGKNREKRNFTGDYRGNKEAIKGKKSSKNKDRK
ncbi:ribonuclease P [Candidatus Acidianus copahuensis]|uniref:Ribonuclease P protein component 4 n=1 Tax=Candidatus Acidianus copahuensis TaxID=1160895 RepID=A0A031LLF6_9CREN|nr:ribonuclease P [Candidatus Acidianus copahuensis]NON62307.1 RNAse P, Rpr2/Rpp21 subunit [Acidianus sp. RZ1]